MIHPRRSDARSTFLRHPTVSRLRDEFGGGCPREAMRTLAFRAIESARGLGWTGPPFDVQVLASLHDLQVQFVDWLSDEQEGCLVPGRPAVIHINSSISRKRARYTIAHEIAHILLQGFGAVLGEHRHWKYRHDGQSPVEQLCQVGASELLMPSDVFYSVVGDSIETLTTAREIAGRFEVSLEAAARNLVDRSRASCAMVVLQMMNKPSELTTNDQMALPGLDLPAARKRLRVRYGWTSRAMDCFLPPFKSIPDHSSLYAVLEHLQSSSLPSLEDWNEVAGIGTVEVEGTVIGGMYASEPQVLCIVRK